MIGNIGKQMDSLFAFNEPNTACMVDLGNAEIETSAAIALIAVTAPLQIVYLTNLSMIESNFLNPRP